MEVQIILLAPKYEVLTEHTHYWQKELLSGCKDEKKNVVLIPNEDLSRANLIKLLERNLKIRKIIIFYGHGEEDYIKGPPLQKKDSHSVLLSDSDYLLLKNSNFFAYCCKSAKKFGKKFESLKNSKFIGFKKKIGMVFKDLFLEKCKEIVNTLSMDIIEKNSVTKAHKDLLFSLYSQAIEYFFSDEGRKNEHWWLFAKYLINQRKSIDFVRGV